MSNTSLSSAVQNTPSSSPSLHARTITTVDDSTAIFLDNAQLNDRLFQHDWPSESVVAAVTTWCSHKGQ